MEPESLKIICFLFDPNVGGPHVRARNVYAAMRENGHHARVAIPAGEGAAEAFHRRAGIPVDRLPIRKPVSPARLRQFLTYLAALPFGVYRAIHYLRHQRPDVVHVNGASDLVPALAARLARVPLVWHLNDTAVPKRLAPLFGAAIRVLADRTVAAAGAVATHYGLLADDVDIVYAPVDTRRFTPRDGTWVRPSGPVRVGMVANWNPLKGQDRFIEVVCRLIDRGHDIQATMIGHAGPSQLDYWKPLQQSIESRGLSRRFTLLGYVDDVPSALSNLHITLLTSRSEACPISVLESMAVGVPQVCFRVGGVDELLGTTGPDRVGISVPEGDIEAMVAAVEDLLTDTNTYSAFSKAAPGRAQHRFSVRRCVERHEAVYSAATEAKSS